MCINLMNKDKDKKKKPTKSAQCKLIADQTGLKASTIQQYTSRYNLDVYDVEGTVEFIKGLSRAATPITDEELLELDKRKKVADTTRAEQEAIKSIESAKKEKFATQKEELKVKQLEGSLISIEEVEHSFEQLGYILKSELQTWVGELPIVLEGLEANNIKKILERKLDVVLKEISKKTKYYEKD